MRQKSYTEYILAYKYPKRKDIPKIKRILSHAGKSKKKITLAESA